MKDIPQDIADALESAGLEGFFADCTQAHRNEYLKWIGEAKRPETRKARIGKAMHMISRKRAEEKKRARKRA
ncbi:MAG: YdeI/OmpD-associated family protein [Verrucomicrobiota bacterium]|jgi:uncharacterized protein YdeI (YjbR/CyaY-like superfamily)